MGMSGGSSGRRMLRLAKQGGSARPVILSLKNTHQAADG